MDQFDLNRKNALTKLDKSRKRGIDGDIKYLLDGINSKKNYFTTSSCSGRIMVIAKGARKDKCDWLFSSHSPIRFSELELGRMPKKDAWFNQEAFIVHICCRELSDAEKMLEIGRSIGMKRPGIISTKKNKIMIELMGNEAMETIIAKKGKLLIDDNYFKNLVDEANHKLRKTKRKIKEFYNEIKKLD